MNNVEGKRPNPAYIRTDEESDDILKEQIRSYYADLDKEINTEELRNSALFDYYDNLAEEVADQLDVQEAEILINAAAKGKESGRKPQYLIALYAGRKMFLNGKLSSSDYLSMLVHIAKEEPKFRSKRHESEKNQIETMSEDNPQKYLKRLYVAMNCDFDKNQNEKISELEKKLKRTKKKVFTDIEIEKFGNALIDTAISYKAVDFLRQASKEGKKGIDPLYLYLKNQAHKEENKNDNAAGIDDPAAEERLLIAQKLIQRLGPDTSEDLLIPVIVDEATRCGIYIAGKSYFPDEEEKHFGTYGSHGPYAGLNIISYMNLGEKDYRKLKTTKREYFENNSSKLLQCIGYCYDFKQGQDLEDLKADFKDIITLEEADYFSANGEAPEDCPEIFKKYFSKEREINYTDLAEKQMQEAEKSISNR